MEHDPNAANWFESQEPDPAGQPAGSWSPATPAQQPPTSGQVQTPPTPKRRPWAAVGLVASGLVAGGVLAGAVSANAATPTSAPSSGYSSSASGSEAGQPSDATHPEHGTAAHEALEKPVTGDNATKAQAAAEKSVGSGSKAGAVTTDMSGTGYEVTVTKADGSSVEVHMDQSFTIHEHGRSGG
jgi:hypothetical protein